MDHCMRSEVGRTGTRVEVVSLQIWDLENLIRLVDYTAESEEECWYCPKIERNSLVVTGMGGV